MSILKISIRWMLGSAFQVPSICIDSLFYHPIIIGKKYARETGLLHPYSASLRCCLTTLNPWSLGSVPLHHCTCSSTPYVSTWPWHRALLKAWREPSRDLGSSLFPPLSPLPSSAFWPGNSRTFAFQFSKLFLWLGEKAGAAWVFPILCCSLDILRAHSWGYPGGHLLAYYLVRVSFP